MKNLLKSILILWFIIFIFFLIGRGEVFWGSFLLFILIIYIYNIELRKIDREFSWIARSIMDDGELRGCKEQKVIYHCAIACFYDNKIKKGMTIAEFAKAVVDQAKGTNTKLEGEKSEFLKNRAWGKKSYDRDKENYTLIYFDYGTQMPTPELRFKFKKGDLVRIDRINQGF